MNQIKLPPAGLSQGMLKRQRLRDHLVTELKAGRFLPGQLLPTEVEIARQLNISRNTVRHALGELEQQGLVRRVQGKGTFVTEKASNQPTSRTASFALVVLDVVTGYYRELFAAFEQFANQSGHTVVICNSKNDIDRQGNHILGLLDQQAAGVVLNPSSKSVTPAYHVRVLQNAGIPVVLLHRSVPHVSAPVLEIPGAEVGRRSGRLLTEAGHRRIAFIDSHRTDLGDQLVSGLREALADVGAELPEKRVDFGTMTQFDRSDFQECEAYVAGVIKGMLSSDAPPTALFLGWPEIAERAYLMALRMGLRVPEDLSIICYGGAHQSGAILSRLTRVTLDETAEAQRAVQLLIEMREGRRPISDCEVIPLLLGFAAGETLGPPARR